MNDQLWKAVQAFNLNEPDGEYGFTIRLAHENNWTKNFTNKAITEYKKFMYLAATAGIMVSPSEIVDIVWHQHLIFTSSYKEFCKLLGKEIQHIPSTHNRDEYEQFRLARDRTRNLYEKSFGKQPPDIWEHETMQAPLQLTKSKTDTNTLLVLIILLCFALLIPFSKLLAPMYTQLNGPQFLFFYGLTFLTTTFLMTRHNRRYFLQIVRAWPEYSFAHHLHPMELVYLKYRKLSYIIHGYMDQLVRNNTVRVHDKNTMITVDEPALTAEEQAIVNTMKENPDADYRTVMELQMQKPIFRNIADTMYSFREELLNSTAYVRLYFLNLAIVTFLLLLGCSRWLIGTGNHKPIAYLSILLFGLFIVARNHIKRIEKDLFETVIPDTNRASTTNTQEAGEDWQWAYLLVGMTALTSSFEPVASNIERVDRNYDGGSGGCGSSCGSGDGGGGSCGSGCGGCGGGD